MSSNKKTIVAGALGFVLAFLSLALFISLCWTAAADAQGAIAFFVFAPVLIVLLVGSYLLSRFAGNAIGRITKKVSMVLAVFYIAFYIAPFVGLGKFTDSVIGGVAKSFKAMTGKTPMEWDKNY